MEDLRFEEQLVQLRIEFLIFYGHLQDIERAVRGDRFLIRPVRRGKRVKNVADGHDLCLYGDFRRLQFVRVARPIQFLVVGADDSGNLANLLGPRNLEQKIEAMDDVILNLLVLVRE